MGFYGADVVCGVELSAGKPDCALMLVRYRKGRLSVMDQKKFDNQAALCAYLDRCPGVPIVLKTQGLSVGKWLPDLCDDPLREVMGVSVENKKDFIVQTFPGAEEGSSFAVVARRDVHDPLLEALGSARKRVIRHYFSNVILSALIPCLSAYSPSKTYILPTSSGDYWWRNGLIPAQSIGGECITTASCAEDFEIEPEWLPLYGAVVHHWMYPQEPPTFPEISFNQQAIRRSHRWLRWMVWALWLLIGLLLVNLTIRTIAFVKRKQAEAHLGTGNTVLQQIANNQQLIDELKEEIGQNQNRKFSRISVQTDLLASVAGRDIVFDDLVFFPSRHELRKVDDRLVMHPPDILIRGQAKTSGSISSLVEGIRKMNEPISPQLFFSEYNYGSGWYEFIILGFSQSEKTQE